MTLFHPSWERERVSQRSARGGRGSEHQLILSKFSISESDRNDVISDHVTWRHEESIFYLDFCWIVNWTDAYIWFSCRFRRKNKLLHLGDPSYQVTTPNVLKRRCRFNWCFFGFVFLTIKLNTPDTFASWNFCSFGCSSLHLQPHVRNERYITAWPGDSPIFFCFLRFKKKQNEIRDEGAMVFNL